MMVHRTDFVRCGLEEVLALDEAGLVVVEVATRRAFSPLMDGVERCLMPGISASKFAAPYGEQSLARDDCLAAPFGLPAGLRDCQLGKGDPEVIAAVAITCLSIRFASRQGECPASSAAPLLGALDRPNFRPVALVPRILRVEVSSIGGNLSAEHALISVDCFSVGPRLAWRPYMRHSVAECRFRFLANELLT
jgi:hypothetical protein